MRDCRDVEAVLRADFDGVIVGYALYRGNLKERQYRLLALSHANWPVACHLFSKARLMRRFDYAVYVFIRPRSLF